jgi:hypothetical protein
MMSTESRGTVEYMSLMRRGQDAERVALLCWTAGALTAAVTMSWAIAARNSGLMLPAVFAIAIGFYAMLRGRHQVRAIGGYIETFHEGTGEARWFGLVHRLQHQPGYPALGDWLTVCLANAGVVLALVLAWSWADASPHGELMSGIVTGVSVLFGFHSISETVRMGQTDWTSLWRRADGDTRDASRAGRAA